MSFSTCTETMILMYYAIEGVCNMCMNSKRCARLHVWSYIELARDLDPRYSGHCREVCFGVVAEVQILGVLISPMELSSRSLVQKEALHCVLYRLICGLSESPQTIEQEVFTCCAHTCRQFRAISKDPTTFHNSSARGPWAGGKCHKVWFLQVLVLNITNVAGLDQVGRMLARA